MKISLEINHPTVREACRIVMRHCEDKAFLELIETQNFNYCEPWDGKSVAILLGNRSRLLEFVIKPYKTMNPFSSVIGHAVDSTVFLNERKIDLELWDRVQNIYHEATHLMGFKHKGNRVTSFNLETVPYKASLIFSNYCKSIYDR